MLLAGEGRLTLVLMGPLWFLLAVLPLLLDLYVGERMVSIQKGPLYRARGTHITIWCNVSGYQMEQEFQWFVYLLSSPQRMLQIISTRDKSFTYYVYSNRVKSGEIYIERIRENSVLLHITDLKEKDAGKYECYVPNEENLGTYSATTNLSVIPDTFSVTMKTQILMQNEGDSLDLICQVSVATAQHTHISVAWYIIPEGGDRYAQKILSLSKDGVVLPGPSYIERFISGDISIVKIGGTEYKFSYVKLQHSDQGEVYCEAVEWIQDPDGTWKDIVQKETSRTSLTIKRLGKKMNMNNSAVIDSSLYGRCRVHHQDEPAKLSLKFNGTFQDSRWAEPFTPQQRKLNRVESLSSRFLDTWQIQYQQLAAAVLYPLLNHACVTLENVNKKQMGQFKKEKDNCQK
ncbi:immunoglobulin superfamily member 2-like [Candoia aspera]|uniref:immunoglobulin superfamily member 2-like n=1 Tax=Candoia aspera TaxID=51853 RepID=UPI002FD82609